MEKVQSRDVISFIERCLPPTLDIWTDVSANAQAFISNMKVKFVVILQSCKPCTLFQPQHELWKCQGHWFRSQLLWATFPLSLALYYGPERWERGYLTSRSLQRHCVRVNYMVMRASFVLHYFKSVYENELHFHITGGLSISRNVCWKISRVSGKPFSIELIY